MLQLVTCEGRCCSLTEMMFGDQLCHVHMGTVFAATKHYNIIPGGCHHYLAHN